MLGFIRFLVEATTRMGEHCINFASIRNEVGVAGIGVLAISFRLGEQLLKIGDVAVDRRAELLVAFVLPLDLVEGLLAL